MPSSPIISVRNIGKKYKLGATLGGRNFTTLRDVLTQVAFGPFRKLSAAFRKEPSTGGSHSSSSHPVTQSPNNLITQLHNNSITKSPNNSNEFWALKDISFDVQQGEVVGIIGRNGAGKSTLLKILSEITEPTEGEIRIKGRVASLLEVGTGFHPELSGRENVYMNGAILGMTKAEINRKFDEIVAFAEVEKFIDTPVKRYSSGMYVRLAFAVAAHLEPEILLVDEVLAVGDVAFQKKCLGKMGDVAKEGRTVLFVSHNMAAIQRLCALSVLLDKGRAVTQGNTADVIGHYLSIGKRTQMDIDLYELAREQDMGTRARISKCCIYDARGKPTSSLAFGEAFTVEVECKVLKPIEDVSFLVGIDSIYEQRIVTITSLENGKTFSAAPGDRVSGRLRINKLLLKPGIYPLTVGLFATNIGIDRVPDVARIQINDLSYSPRHIHVSQITVGMIQMPDPYWEILR